MPSLGSGDPEFYVGYQPQVPAALAQRTRRVAGWLLVLAVSLAASLVVGQRAFDASRFEFQQYQEYRGLLSAWPYPILTTPGGDYLLVGEGKHGFAMPSGDVGRPVRLLGAMAENGGVRMLELLPGSLAFEAGPLPQRTVTPRETITLSGEIVDAKCHLGVMNPGRGKVHRDCAARCIRGGLPPALLAHDATGKPRLFLLTGVSREDLLPVVAEPVRITGRVVRAGSLWVMETTAGEIRRE